LCDILANKGYVCGCVEISLTFRGLELVQIHTPITLCAAYTRDVSGGTIERCLSIARAKLYTNQEKNVQSEMEKLLLTREGAWDYSVQERTKKNVRVVVRCCKYSIFINYELYLLHNIYYRYKVKIFNNIVFQSVFKIYYSSLLNFLRRDHNNV